MQWLSFSTGLTEVLCALMIIAIQSMIVVLLVFLRLKINYSYLQLCHNDCNIGSIYNFCWIMHTAVLMCLRS